MDLRGAAHAHNQHRGLVGARHHYQQPLHSHPIPASTNNRQPATTYGSQPRPDAQEAAPHLYLGTAITQGPQGPHGTHTQHPQDPVGRPDSQQAQHPPPPPLRDQATDAPRGGPHQRIDWAVPADTDYRESPVPRPPRETPSPHPTRNNDDQPDPHHPLHHTTHHQLPHRPNPTPYTTPQRYGSTSGGSETRGCYASAPLAAPSPPGQAPRSRQPPWERASETSSSTPPSMSPDTTAPHAPPLTGRARPPPRRRIEVFLINWGRHLVGHPMPGRMDTKGRSRYHEPDMAHPPQSATPSDPKEWERETWVAPMASLSNFRHHVLGDVPFPKTSGQPPPRTCPSCTICTAPSPPHTTTHRVASWWYTAPTLSSPPTGPPPNTTQAPTRTPGRTRLTTPTSGVRENASPWTPCSPSSAATRALVARCIALTSGPNGPGGSPQTGGCGRSPCTPSRGRPPQTTRDPPPRAPLTYSSACT